MDFTIKINVNERRRFDPPRVILKFRSQAYVLIYNCERTNEILTKKNSKIFTLYLYYFYVNNLDFFLVSMSLVLRDQSFTLKLGLVKSLEKNVISRFFF